MGGRLETLKNADVAIFGDPILQKIGLLNSADVVLSSANDNLSTIRGVQRSQTEK